VHHFGPHNFDIISVTCLSDLIKEKFGIRVKVGRLGAETVGVNGEQIKSDTVFVTVHKQIFGLGDSAVGTHIAGIILIDLRRGVTFADTGSKRLEVESVAA
jgi:hypothetical protein